MKITIIGTGNMAQAIGARLRAADHEVVFHSRDIAQARKTMHRDLLANVDIEQLGSDVAPLVILAVPYGNAFEEIANKYGDKLNDKVLVDITNPMDFNTLELLLLTHSASEELATLLPKSHVVKAFNTVFATRLAAGSEVAGLPIDVYLAGNNQSAKQIVSDLIHSLGMRPLDTGSLSEARYLEGFEAIHLRLQSQLGNNWNTAVKIVG